MKPDTIPLWLWRLALAALLGAVLATSILLALALGGVSNPRQVGTLVVRDDLDQDAGWELKSGEAQGELGSGVYQVVLPGRKARAFVLAPYQAQAPCTIMIAARQTGGPSDAGYGLWWGDLSGGHYNVVAVNGDGYITVFQAADGSTKAIMEWQVFPRIRPQGETNTIQVDIADGQVLVRVVDEVVVTFDWAPDQPIETGFYVETSSAGGTIADLDWLTIWHENGG